MALKQGFGFIISEMPAVWKLGASCGFVLYTVSIQIEKRNVRASVPQGCGENCRSAGRRTGNSLLAKTMVDDRGFEAFQ